MVARISKPQALRPGNFVRTHPNDFHKGSYNRASSGASSPPVPIPGGIDRTESESNLLIREGVADYEDFRMYQRIVVGIKKKQAAKESRYLKYQDDVIIRKIISTRAQEVVMSTLHREMSPLNCNYYNSYEQGDIFTDDDDSLFFDMD